MKWFRLHSEFATDPKLKTFSKAQRYALVCLMCLASEDKDRGTIHLDAEDIAATLEMDEAEYEEFIAKLVRKGIVEIQDGLVVFTNWIARQYDKPSDSPAEAAERKRRSRAGQESSGVTLKQQPDHSHAPVTPESRAVTPYKQNIHRTDSETDSDNNKTPLISPAESEPLPEVSDDVVLGLVQIGLSPRIAAETARQYPAERITRQISHLASQRPRDRPAWLLQAIREDWQPPPEGPPDGARRGAVITSATGQARQLTEQIEQMRRPKAAGRNGT